MCTHYSPPAVTVALFSIFCLGIVFFDWADNLYKLNYPEGSCFILQGADELLDDEDLDPSAEETVEIESLVVDEPAFCRGATCAARYNSTLDVLTVSYTGREEVVMLWYLPRVTGDALMVVREAETFEAGRFVDCYRVTHDEDEVEFVRANAVPYVSYVIAAAAFIGIIFTIIICALGGICCRSRRLLYATNVDVFSDDLDKMSDYGAEEEMRPLSPKTGNGGGASKSRPPTAGQTGTGAAPDSGNFPFNGAAPPILAQASVPTLRDPPNAGAGALDRFRGAAKNVTRATTVVAALKPPENVVPRPSRNRVNLNV